MSLSSSSIFVVVGCRKVVAIKRTYIEKVGSETASGLVLVSSHRQISVCGLLVDRRPTHLTQRAGQMAGRKGDPEVVLSRGGLDCQWHNSGEVVRRLRMEVGERTEAPLGLRLRVLR